MTEPALRLVEGEGDRRYDVREFFRVARIVPDQQEVVTIPAGTPVREALARMDQHGFSRIPVVAGNTVIGVFSHRSLARQLGSLRPQDNPLDAPVDDLLEDLKFVRAGDEVGAILDHLDCDGAVLVGDEDDIRAVATSSDVISFLWSTTLPFVLLQDIELAVRDLMRCACPSMVELQGLIKTGLPPGSGEKPSLEDLTLGELLGVLLHGPSFGKFFSKTFGPNRDIVRGHLDITREIRNKVFHFRSDTTAADLDQLLRTRRWLFRKVQIQRSRI